MVPGQRACGKGPLTLATVIGVVQVEADTKILVRASQVSRENGLNERSKIYDIQLLPPAQYEGMQLQVGPCRVMLRDVNEHSNLTFEW